jgi:hypothetical protein
MRATGTPHATAAAKHVGRLNRTAALTPPSRSRKVRSSQLASATRRANDSSLRSGCAPCESAHDRSLEIGAAAASTWSHEHAETRERVNQDLINARSSTSAPLASRNSKTSMAPLRIAASSGVFRGAAGAVRILKRNQRKIDLCLARAATQTSPGSARQRRAANDLRQTLSRTRRAPPATASSRARAGESRAHALA